MKKSTFNTVMLLALMGWAAPLSAQIGFKAGANLASLAEEGTNPNAQDIKANSAIGAVVGATFDLDLTEVFTLQPEFLFIQKGGKSEFYILGTRTEQIHLINYFEIPVLAKFRFGNNGKKKGLGFYIAAGPWAGLAINGKYKASVYDAQGELIGDPFEEKYTFDDEDDRKRLDWGASGAAGLVVGRMTLEGRYNYGINNLLDNDANNNNDNKPVLQTRGISVTLGITL